MEDDYESKFFIGLTKKIILSYPNIVKLKKVCNVLQTLASARKLCKSRNDSNTSSKKDHGCLLKTIMDRLNASVLSCVPETLLRNFIKEFAKKSCNRLDGRLIHSLTTIHEDFGVPLVIISSGCSDAIEQTLRLVHFPVHMIVANQFERCGNTIVGFKLDIYGNKGKILQKILADRGLTTDETVFIGDDPQDEECFKMVKFPIVSFLADENDRKFLVKECNAFAPATEDELMAFIRSECLEVSRLQ